MADLRQILKVRLPLELHGHAEEGAESFGEPRVEYPKGTIGGGDHITDKPRDRLFGEPGEGVAFHKGYVLVSHQTLVEGASINAGGFETVLYHDVGPATGARAEVNTRFSPLRIKIEHVDRLSEFLERS